MKCQTHTELDAVAVCSRCWRPLCRDCCAIIAGKVTCKARCEEDQFYTERNNAIQREKAVESQRSIGPAIGVGLGTMILVKGYFMLEEANSLDSSEMQIISYIIGGIGVLLIWGAIASFLHREDNAS